MPPNEERPGDDAGQCGREATSDRAGDEAGPFRVMVFLRGFKAGKLARIASGEGKAAWGEGRHRYCGGAFRVFPVDPETSTGLRRIESRRAHRPLARRAPPIHGHFRNGRQAEQARQGRQCSQDESR
jgi:hypothetical protein